MEKETDLSLMPVGKKAVGYQILVIFCTTVRRQNKSTGKCFSVIFIFLFCGTSDGCFTYRYNAVRDIDVSCVWVGGRGRGCMWNFC